MSEWITCTKCGALKETLCACPGCEGGTPITITATPIYVSPAYAAAVERRKKRAGGASANE